MDLGNYLRFVLALLFVLGLIGLLAAVVRRYGLGMNQGQVRKGTERRLSLVEVLPIDAKRRAVLIRRDGVEHLVLLGAESDTVVETHISTPPPASEPETQTNFAEVLDSAQAKEPKSPSGANS